MPTDVAFDTRKEFKRFAESGSFDDAQADLLVGVATKDDVRALDTKIDHSVADLQKDINTQGREISAKIDAQGHEISAKISAESNATFLRMIWVVGLGVAFIAGLFSLLAFFVAQGG